METNSFWEKYLTLLIDRLTPAATVISISFWYILSIFEAVTFSGTFLDIFIVTAGLITTAFLIVSPKDYQTGRILIDNRKRYIAQIYENLQCFTAFWIWSGAITLLFDLLSQQPLSTFAFVPKAFGVLGIIIALFLPDEETLED